MIWKQYWRLLAFVKPYRRDQIIAVIAMLVVAAGNSAVPIFIEPIMDHIFINKQAAMLWPLALGIVLAFAIKGIAGYTHAYLLGRMGHRIIADLRNKLMHSILRQDLTFFVERSSGEMVSRFTYDTSQVQTSVTKALTAVFQHALTFVGLLAVVFYQNWKLALIAALVFPIAVQPMRKFARGMRKHSKGSQEQMAVLNSLCFETFTGIRVLKLFRIEKLLGKRIEREVERLFETFRKMAALEALNHPLMEWIGSLGVAAIMLLGGHLVIAQQMSAGEFFSFLAAVLMLYDPIRRMNGTVQQIEQGVAAAERIFAWIDQTPTITSANNAKSITTVTNGVCFENVSFRYRQEGSWILSNISFNLPKGKLLALVGPSGAGKSTIADLLPRFYDPTSGHISIDGIALPQIELNSLRDLIAMVDQHTMLFDGTVYDNILYGKPTATRADVIAAAQMAYADSFICKLPQGYDTPIGENGVKLSGGQRQRIAIARALLKNAPILILDEATSALDTESEREVQKALEHLLKDRTSLVIAHRLSTIVAADDIVVLEHGKIIEQGSHHTLMANHGLYHRLYTMQQNRKEHVESPPQ